MWSAAAEQPSSGADSRRVPNIVFILADDLGYGDVQCLNPEGKIATPNLDRLAAAGMVFTDAHSSSAVCTPTRYSILTGRYNWRSSLKNGVLGGYSPRLIETGRYFGISASLDMPPYVFIENDRVRGVPTVEKTWIRKGPAHADFEAIDVLPTLTAKAVKYIDQRAAEAQAGRPFCLYLPLNSPHTPILPTAEWQGKSGLNAYGDFVMQTDQAVGQVLQALDRGGLRESTLVIFASDNGCSPSANFPQLAAQGHHPSYRFRGHKADIFDGGHRIPCLARWPGRIPAGSASDQLVCLVDWMATCADILGAKLPETAGEDSVSLLPALLGQARGPLREAVVQHSINGSFSIRQGRWKLELCPDSGGWSAPKPGSAEAKRLPSIQLYDLVADIGEQHNVHDEHPEVVDRLTKLLEKYVADGRSTPGAPQPNTGDVKLGKNR